MESSCTCGDWRERSRPPPRSSRCSHFRTREGGRRRRGTTCSGGRCPRAARSGWRWATRKWPRRGMGGRGRRCPPVRKERGGGHTCPQPPCGSCSTGHGPTWRRSTLQETQIRPRKTTNWVKRNYSLTNQTPTIVQFPRDGPSSRWTPVLVPPLPIKSTNNAGPDNHLLQHLRVNTPSL